MKSTLTGQQWSATDGGPRDLTKDYCLISAVWLKRISL